MIDFPTGRPSPPIGSTSSTAPTSPAADATAVVQQKVDAVVVEVTARKDSGNLEQPGWNILLKLNPGATTPADITTTLTTAALQTLQAGQALLVQTESQFPLPLDTRLQVNASLSQGLVIQQAVAPDPLQAIQQSLVKLLAPQQQSLAPLLANLIQLLRQDTLSQLESLPVRVQTAIRDLITSLPDPSTVREPGQLQNLLENSGLLLEAKLNRLIQQLRQDIGTGVAGSSATAKATPAGTSPVPAKPDLPPSATTISRPPEPASPLQQLRSELSHDLKHGLMQLEQALRGATAKEAASQRPAEQATPGQTVRPDSGQPTTPQSQQPVAVAIAKATTSPATVSASALQASAPASPAETASQTAPAVDGNSDTPLKDPMQVLRELARRVEAGQAGKLRTPEQHPGMSAPTGAEPETTQSTLAIQRYVNAARSGSEHHPGTQASHPGILAPPLPGQILVQAQPRANTNLQGNELADALVKTLLSQVRGALARVNLHQLSSAASKQDSSPTSTLSFEIPFLFAGQVDLFQLRIDSEAEKEQDRKNKNLGKRWVVQLGFDIEGLGPMFCQLSLTGKSMAVSFWAAWEQTLAETKAHFNFLEQSLNNMGIRVEKIQAQLGMPELDRTGVRNQLVDIKT